MDKQNKKIDFWVLNRTKFHFALWELKYTSTKIHEKKYSRRQNAQKKHVYSEKMHESFSALVFGA